MHNKANVMKMKAKTETEAAVAAYKPNHEQQNSASKINSSLINRYNGMNENEECRKNINK